jgi:hypothetical protein
MAIFVSNPTSAAAPTLSSDALDPLAIAPVEGFTEELAAAMLPGGGALETLALGKQSKQDLLEEADQKASDLQILPAEVLMNAVGDANFAFSAQAQAANSTPTSSLNNSALLATQEAQESQVPDHTALELNTQAAELAAANLAAQMAATLPQQPGSVGSGGQALNIGETNPLAQAPVVQTIADANAIENQAANLASTASAQAKLAASANSESAIANSISSLRGASIDTNVANGSGASSTPNAALALAPVQSAESASAVGPLSAPTELDATQTAKLESVLEKSAANLSSPGTAPTSTSTATASSVQSPNSSTSSSSISAPATPASSVGLSTATESTLQPGNVATVGAKTGTASSASNATSAVPTTLAQTSSPGQISAQKNPAQLDSKAERQGTEAQESAFNFDAKISSKDAGNSTSKVSGSVSVAQPVSNNTLAANTSTPALSNLGLQASRSNEGMANSAPLSAPLPTPSSAQVIATNNTGLESLAAATPAAQSDTSLASAQSLEDLSSAFVSSLVGGAPRPVSTAMDWISLQAQERPAPVVPHEVRLDAGAVQLEIQKMVKQGGGHVVMELTPPDQSKFTIELKLDERGGALLIVEGVSDSTRTRLEQSAPQLREQFQQMGLELQLDMRQQGQSGSSNAAQFSNSQERESGANTSANAVTSDSPKLLTPREAGANRARETGSNQVYLYA